MPTYNCITDTTLLSVLRYGSTTLIAGSGETLTLDVGKLVEGVPLKYMHIDTGALAEMSAGEKTTVDAAVGAKNTKGGVGALESVSTGGNCTAFGFNAVNANLIGLFCTGFGSNALLLTTANANTGIGAYSLTANVGGLNNTAVGCASLNSNTEGDNNTACGENALRLATTANNNCAFGKDSMDANLTGQNNVAMGVNSLGATTDGDDNVCLGNGAGASLTGTDSNNIIIKNFGAAGQNNVVKIGSSLHNDTYLFGVQWREQATVTDLVDTAPTLTTAQLTAGLFLGTPTAARNWTLPTALVLITTNLTNPSVNDSFKFSVVNRSAGAFDITIVVASGVTAFGSLVILGSAVATTAGKSARFMIRLTNVTGASEAYEIYRLS